MTFKKPGQGDGRPLSVKLKTARGRTVSSQKWLQRQLNDPYVAKAKAMGYRSRAAFKLIELDDKYHFLKPKSIVIDLGAAPGGWTQVCVERIRPQEIEGGQVIGIDLTEIELIPGASLIQKDFLSDEAPGELIEMMQGKAHAVLSDMAAPATGHTQTDHWRIMGLAEAAFDFAKDVLHPGGVYVAKVLRGGAEGSLLALLKKNFDKVSHFKPASSRKDSAEMYVVALGFRPPVNDE